jgi:hypothetical protein
MKKNPANERDRRVEQLPEPVVLTQEQAEKVAAGLARAGGGCPSCGLSALR